MITGIITLLVTIVGLVTWWLKRKKSPTLAEQIEDVRDEYNDIYKQMQASRKNGDDAGADALLVRLRRVQAKAIGQYGGVVGQLDSNDTPSRDGDSAPKS